MWLGPTVGLALSFDITPKKELRDQFERGMGKSMVFLTYHQLNNDSWRKMMF